MKETKPCPLAAVGVELAYPIIFMTADWGWLPYKLPPLVSNCIVNEVPGVNRVVYDIPSKPPSTTEWEHSPLSCGCCASL